MKVMSLRVPHERLLLLALGLIVCGRGHAQTSASSDAGTLAGLLARRPILKQTLSLDDAVTIALRESPVVRGAQEEVEAALGRVNVARAQTRPSLSLNTFASGGSNSNIVASPMITQPQMIMALPRDAFLDQNLMLMLPLDTGGRLNALVHQAASLRNATAADLEGERQEVALMSRMAYREVLARRALTAVARTRLAENRERLRVDQNRFEQGAVPALTLRRDEADVAATEQEVTNSERDAELSLVQLKTVMGVHPASEFTLSEVNAYEPSAVFLAGLTASVVRSSRENGGTALSALPQDLSQLLRIAEEKRPELQASAERIRAAKADTSAIKGAYETQINLFAMGDVSASHATRGFGGTTFGLVASFPLYSGGERQGRIQTSEAERRKQEEERERLGLQIAQEVTTALLNLRAAERNILTAKTAEAAATEGYRVALERYQAGRSLLVEVEDALTARAQAESNTVLALFQYNVAKDQLLRAVGALSSQRTSTASLKPAKK